MSSAETQPCFAPDRAGCGVWWPWLALRLVMLAACGGPEFCAAEPPPPTLRVPLQALAVADDDGRRPARVTADQVQRWVDYANRVFEAARIQFEFDAGAGHFQPLRDTVVNNLAGAANPQWVAARDHADEVAARFPGRLVVFFRHGPGQRATGVGYAGYDHHYVVMPGWEDAAHCGHARTGSLAHEIGHYLGLPHTFPGEPFATEDDAARWFGERGNDPNVFDGDGFSDTPPDPAIRTLECPRTERVTLNGVTFELPRRNLMSYYDERDSISQQQVARVRWVLQERLKGNMLLPDNRPTGVVLEAESLPIVTRAGCKTSVQRMSGFIPGRWSGDSQIFVTARQDSAVTMAVAVPDAGRYRVRLYATRAPDYGRIRCRLDEDAIGSEIDLYAPLVLPTGAIDLGVIRLTRGEHRLTFTVAGKDSESTGYRFGIDALELTAQ